MSFVFLSSARAQYGNGELAAEPLVDLAVIDPTLVIDLRYASDRNIAHHPLYPPGTLCMVRSGVAEHLKQAQLYLRQQGYGLKIWDAYRSAEVQQVLWDLVKNPEVVASPAKGGSFHTWGVAVDVTLVDSDGRDVPMPTDFDDFTPAAKSQYTGINPVVAKNLHLLQSAMMLAGFTGMRDEWWHFTIKNYMSYKGSPSPAPTPAPPLPTPSASPVSPAPAAYPTPLPLPAEEVGTSP